MPDFNNLIPRSNDYSTLMIIGLALALVVTILLYCLVFPRKKDGKLPGFFQFLKNFFEVRYLLIEKLIKFFYVLLTFAFIFCGLIMTFTVEPFYVGLIVMILGPIALRFVHEILMLAILLVKNTIEINNKLPDKNTGKKHDLDPIAFSGGPAYKFEPYMQHAFDQSAAQPAFDPNQQPYGNPGVKVCPTCGATASSDSDFCAECGSRMV